MTTYIVIVDNLIYFFQGIFNQQQIQIRRIINQQILEMIKKKNITCNPFRSHRKTFFQQLKCKKVLAQISSNDTSKQNISASKFCSRNHDSSINIKKNHQKSNSNLHILVTKQNAEMINKIQQLNLISNSLKMSNEEKQTNHINTKQYWKKLNPKIAKLKRISEQQDKKQQNQNELPYKKYFYEPPQLIENFVTGGYCDLNDISEQEIQIKQNSPINRFKKIKDKFYTLQNICQSIKKTSEFKKLENVRYSEQYLGNIIHNIQLEEIGKIGSSRKDNRNNHSHNNNKTKIQQIKQENKVISLRKKMKVRSTKKYEKNLKGDSVLLYLSYLRQKLLK